MDKKEEIMKREYIKPAMQAVKIQQQHIICYSQGAKSLGNNDYFEMKDGGWYDNDEDM